MWLKTFFLYLYNHLLILFMQLPTLPMVVLVYFQCSWETGYKIMLPLLIFLFFLNLSILFEMSKLFFIDAFKQLYIRIGNYLLLEFVEIM